MKGNGIVTRERVMGADGIGDDQRVLTVLMLEVVIKTFLFHEPADEIEVGFPVLNAVLPLFVTARQFQFVIAEPVVFEDVLDNVRHGHLLENAAIGCAGEKPKPGNDRGAILSKAARSEEHTSELQSRL